MVKIYAIIVTISFIIVTFLFLRTTILPVDTVGAGNITENVSGQSIRITELERELEDSRETNNKLYGKLRDNERTVKSTRAELNRYKANIDRTSNTITSITAISGNLEEGQRNLESILESVQARGTITITK